MTSARRLTLSLLLLSLAACGKSAPPTAAGGPIVPSDPKLAKLYAQTCKACHANPGSGAPLAGDTAAWAPRVKQGDKILVEHAINGYKGMPPMGACSDCSEADFNALIRFMSGAT